MTPPPSAPALPDPRATAEHESSPATAPEPDETADLFRWMSWSAALAMNA